MNALKKTAAGTLLGGAMLIGGGLSLAHAAPPAPEAQAAGDAQVDIAVSTNGTQIGIIQNVSVANAVSLVNAVCPVSGITEATINDLDVNGTAITQTCTGMTGLSFVFTQNALDEGSQNGNQGKSENAPGQNRNTETTPPSATAPSTPPGQVGR